MTAYNVTAIREGKWWLLEVTQVGAYGQARSLAEAEGAARDIIALNVDADPQTIEVTIHARADKETVDALSQADEMAARADAMKAEAARLRSVAVREFVESTHTPYRDAAKALRMSPQRVHQLIKN